MPRIEIGSTAYLHRSDDAFDADETHLLISAHGAALPGSFTVPGWANLHFYGKHGAAIYDPGVRNIIDGKYQVMETASGGGTSHSYLLSKYQGSHGSESETYESLQKDVNSNAMLLRTINNMLQSGDEKQVRHASRALGRQNFAFRFDVCTIRSRWHHKAGITLKSLLDNLAQNGYRYGQVHCSFCRWRPFGGDVSATTWGS